MMYVSYLLNILKLIQIPEIIRILNCSYLSKELVNETTIVENMKPAPRVLDFLITRSYIMYN